MGQETETASNAPVAEYVDDMVVQLALMARASGQIERAELLEAYGRRITGLGREEPPTDRFSA